MAVGELTAIEPPPEPADGSFSSNDRVTYRATLETVLKGDLDNPLELRSASHGASCGLEGMTVGQDYVFFVRDGESGLCDGTSPATPQLIAEVEAVTGTRPGGLSPRGRRLWGQGLSAVDAHLLGAVALVGGARIWTRDKRLRAACQDVGVTCFVEQ